jgi:spermidine synthase
LGAGIAVTAFAMRNIETTVIEIDPAVYNASRQYFGLPDLGSDRVFLQDARVVISEKRRAALQYGVSPAERYDYVVHDCFSGGGLPAHLFTLQFWEDLKEIMNPDGVVAVVSRSCTICGLDPLANVLPPLKNFAGKINSNSAKAILFTLQRSFGRCRVLHDLQIDQPDLANTFVNLVGVSILVWG